MTISGVHWLKIRECLFRPKLDFMSESLELSICVMSMLEVIIMGLNNLGHNGKPGVKMHKGIAMILNDEVVLGTMCPSGFCFTHSFTSLTCQCSLVRFISIAVMLAVWKICTNFSL